jgi:hypothetical protein
MSVFIVAFRLFSLACAKNLVCELRRPLTAGVICLF